MGGQEHVFASSDAMREALQARLLKRQMRRHKGVRGAHSSQGLSKIVRAHAHKSSDDKLPFSEWMTRHARAPIKPKVAAALIATEKHQKPANSRAKDRQRLNAPRSSSLLEQAHAA